MRIEGRRGRPDARERAAVLAWALADPGVLARWHVKATVEVPGSSCLWWTGAISGRGHGRFWLTPHVVVISHRFAYALACGADAAVDVPVFGHRCDNPLCQRIAPGHVEASTYRANRREWVARRGVLGTPLADPRGARRRAHALRALARTDPGLVGAELERLRGELGVQLALW